jgi:hypothetical protein
VKKDGYGRLKKEKTSDWAEGKIVFLLHSANSHSATTTPKRVIKQPLSYGEEVGRGNKIQKRVRGCMGVKNMYD